MQNLIEHPLDGILFTEYLTTSSWNINFSRILRWANRSKTESFQTFINSQHLLVQSQQGEHQYNVWNMFNVNNRYTSMKAQSVVLIVNFEKISHIILVL